VVKRRLVPAACLGLSGALALSLAACSDLLNLKDLQPYPAEGGADAGEDASPDGPVAEDGGTDATGPDARDAEGAPDGSMAGDGPTMNDGSPKDSSPSDAPVLDAPEDTSPPVDAPEDTAQPVDAPVDTGSGPDSSCTLGTSQNCGSCGHDCLAGACAGGLCQPFTIGSSVTAYDMVVSGSNLYWVDQSTTVWTCTIAGSACNARIFASAQNTPERITLGGAGNGTVFWSNFGSGSAANGSIVSLPLLGGTPSTIASGQWTPQGIAADDTYVFWADTATSQLVRSTLSGSSSTTLSTGANTLPTPVAVGGGKVYWGDDVASGMGAIDSSPESSLTIDPVQSGQATPWAFARDATYLYWVDYVNPGAVWQFTLNGGAKQQLASNEDMPIRIVSDAASAFWIDEGSAGDGKLVEWNVSANTSTDRATGLNQPSALAMDSSAVYFATLDGVLHMMVR
jgi:hypothetical protein